jgi:thiamine-phosphate pyrophosphorylase
VSGAAPADPLRALPPLAEQADLRPLALAELPGWERDDAGAAFRAFLDTCKPLAEGAPAITAEVVLTRRGARSAAARILLRDAGGRVVGHNRGAQRHLGAGTTLVGRRFGELFESRFEEIGRFLPNRAADPRAVMRAGGRELLFLSATPPPVSSVGRSAGRAPIPAPLAALSAGDAALAAEAGCDGAHLGQADGDHAAARKLLRRGTLGITCHASRDLAMRAGEMGADYVAFGAFFPTATKDAPTRAEPALLEWWSGLFEIPCVAIGGITPANCAPLVRAGADFLAVVGAVWNHAEGAAAGVRAMNRAIGEA